MSQIDVCAAISATKHARRSVVTASIDALHFVAPVKVGHFVHYSASVNYAGRTSMEVGVRVDAENPITGELTHTASAYTTFVALDENGRPTAVPPIKPETPTEIRRYSAAQARRASRIELAETIKAGLLKSKDENSPR